MPGNKTLRIILDTNIWISYLISNRQSHLDLIFQNSKASILFSTELLNEIQSVAAKPKLKKYFSAEAMEEMLYAFEDYITLVDIKSDIQMCRDPKDNFLLSLALDGKADYLITGDKDLLALNSFGKTKICSITFFLTHLKSI